MKKLLIIIGIILLLPVIGLGSYSFDLFSFSAKEAEAGEAALLYLEEQYKKEFKIIVVEYSKALGDDHGSYNVQAHPEGNKELSIQMILAEDYEVLNEDYKESKWGDEVRREYLTMADSLLPSTRKLSVYGSFPAEIADQYSLTDTYQEIMAEHPNQSNENVRLFVFEGPVEEQKEFETIYQLWKMVSERELRSYRMEIHYYPSNLVKKFETYFETHQFENDHREQLHYSCLIMSDKVETQPIEKPDDLAGFCRK